MDGEDEVRRHYSGGNLEPVVLGALNDAGVDIDNLRVDDLSALDQLHAGWGPATRHLLDKLALSHSQRLLDVGCGVGGPARMAAALYGCQVTGIDLSADFIELARSLTDRLDLSHLVSFDVGSGAALRYADGSFTRAMLNHVGMNIADKAQVFTEVRRVLQPGGLFAVYDQMRSGDGDLTFPLPWADDEQSSFVESSRDYVDQLERSGFTVDHPEDRTAANAAAGLPGAGTLSPAVLFGNGFEERLANNIASMSGTLSAVLLVARAV